MPWSGGSFTRTNGVHTGSTLWVQDRDAGTKILATRHDTHDQDLADGINATLEKSGSNAATGNLDIGSNRITLVADGTAKTDAATVNQLQSNAPAFQATDTGTANAYVIALSPAITAYAAGQAITFKAANASTTASTLNVNTLGTKALKKKNDQDIASGDIEAAQIITAVYDGTSFQVTSQLASEAGGPGGSNTQVQYNSSGSLAGSANFTFDGTNADVSGDITGSTINADGDTSAGDNAAIGYTAGEGLILTGQGSTDDITIKNDADTTVVNVATGATDVEISAGNILFGTASKGVYLGVTAATAANLLDDYEEGTWTPVIRLGGESGTDNTAGTPTGKYTKIGNQVVITTYCAMDDSLSGTGQVAISGLPFTVNGTHNCPITWTTGDRVDGDIGILAFASAGSAAVLFYVAPATTSATLGYLTQTSLNDGGAGKSFSINGTYYV